MRFPSSDHCRQATENGVRGRSFPTHASEPPISLRHGLGVNSIEVENDDILLVSSCHNFQAMFNFCLAIGLLDEGQ